MVKLVADNGEVEKHLNLLCEIARAEGSFIHEDLSIHCREGDLTVEAPEGAKHGEPLFSLPTPVLLNLDHCGLELQGDDICIASPASDLLPSQLALLESMVAIYNLTNKIAVHKLTSVDNLFFHDKELLRRLTGDQFISVREGRDPERFWLDSFLGSRKIGNKVKTVGESKSSSIMPLVGFVNHHPLAGGFNVGTEKLKIFNFTTPETGNECFVRYGANDDHLLLTGYSYVETRSPIVFSRALDLDVPEFGKFVVHRRVGLSHGLKKVPEDVKNIAGQLPPVHVNPLDGTVIAGSLRIPGRNTPRAMRRVLKHAITQKGAMPSQAALGRIIDFIEREVIEQNLAYYRDFQRDMVSYEPVPETTLIVENMKKMIEGQIRKIEAYSFEAARG